MRRIRLFISVHSVLKWLKSDSRVNDADLAGIRIIKSDFEQALLCVEPSALREGFTTVPDVTWDDIGALKKVREEIQWALLVSMLLVKRTFLNSSTQGNNRW